MSENAVVDGHQLKNLKPNMVFAADWGADGAADVVYAYACLGAGLFSFNVMARTLEYSEGDVNAMVEDAKARAGVEIETDGVRVQGGEGYRKECPWLAN